jgi:hypothetical protein
MSHEGAELLDANRPVLAQHAAECPQRCAEDALANNPALGHDTARPHNIRLPLRRVLFRESQRLGFELALALGVSFNYVECALRAGEAARCDEL